MGEDTAVEEQVQPLSRFRRPLSLPVLAFMQLTGSVLYERVINSILG